LKDSNSSKKHARLQAYKVSLVYGIKAFEGVELYLHPFFKSSLDGGERSDCKACNLYEKIPWYKFTRRQGEPRSWSADFEIKRNVFHPLGSGTKIPRPSSSYPSHQMDWAIPDPIIV
jgi:hypothetical protein